MEKLAQMLSELPQISVSGADFSREKVLEMQCAGENAERGTLLGYDCEKCLNRGYISYIEDGEIQKRTCECMQTRKYIKRAADSGIGELLKVKRFGNYTVSNAEQLNAKQLVIEYAKSDTDKWLFIGGQKGFGKTHLCVAAVRKLLVNTPVQYIVWEREIDRLLEMGFSRYDEREDIIKSWENAPVLLIDDFLRFEQPDRKELRIAFSLINHRANKNLRTIISSQLTTARLIALEEAIAGRIIEKCGKYVISVEYDLAKDYRLNGGLSNGEDNQRTDVSACGT
ncbi:MAG: ATP-binding protein [Clostridia bacterium]|nr:ATP-binding protein [Clostridia bacterium]